MRNTVRYGLVGTGLMANEHLRNLAIIPGAVVTALADPVESSLATAKATLGAAADEAKTFADSAALADSGLVDAVIVASPNYTHRSVLEPLFDAGLAILCEKPLATTLEDARWVADRAAQAKAPFWTAMEYRYMPPVVEYIDQLRAGRDRHAAHAVDPRAPLPVPEEDRRLEPLQPATPAGPWSRSAATSST